MESASGFRSDAAPEMDAFLRQRGMQRGGVQLTQVVLAPVAKSNALQHATAALRSDARSSHARTSNASWIKAYQSLLRHLRRQDSRARQHGAPVGSRQAMIHASYRRLFHRTCLTRKTRSTTVTDRDCCGRMGVTRNCPECNAKAWTATPRFCWRIASTSTPRPKTLAAEENPVCTCDSATSTQGCVRLQTHGPRCQMQHLSAPHNQ